MDSNGESHGSPLGRGHPEPRPPREEAIMEGGQVFAENLYRGQVSKDSEPGSCKMRSISRTVT